MFKITKFRITKENLFPIILYIKRLHTKFHANLLKFLSVKYGSFDTNIAILYDIFMTYVMKCQKCHLSQYHNILNALLFKECGNIVGKCHTCEEVFARKDDLMQGVLYKLQLSIEEWDLNKCPVTK